MPAPRRPRSSPSARISRCRSPIRRRAPMRPTTMSTRRPTWIICACRAIWARLHDRQHLLHLCLCQQDAEHHSMSSRPRPTSPRASPKATAPSSAASSSPTMCPAIPSRMPIASGAISSAPAKDFDFGWLTGQVRAGVWWENSASQRARSDFDATQCFASTANCNPWHDHSFADSPVNVAGRPSPRPSAAASSNITNIPAGTSISPSSNWNCIPSTDLTITPGFKYVWWNHNVTAPLEQKTVPVVPVTGSFTTTRDLPFLMANYKIQPSWSVYAQYAQGIYVPDISSFEQTDAGHDLPQGADHHQLPGRHGLLRRQFHLRRRHLLYRREQQHHLPALQPAAHHRIRRARPAPSIPAPPPTRASKAKAPMPSTAIWTACRCSSTAR